MSGASSIVVSDHNRSGHGTSGTSLKDALLTDWRMEASVGLGFVGIPETMNPARLEDGRGSTSKNHPAKSQFSGEIGIFC